jgi:hypothetical protein
VTGSQSAIDQLRALLIDLRTEESALEAEFEALRAQHESRITAKRLEIAGVEKTVELLASRTLGTRFSVHVPVPNGTAQIAVARQREPVLAANLAHWRAKLRNLTHLEALIRIAEENHGIVRSAEAKRIFIAAGVSEGKPKNIPSQIYRLLADSGEFEKVEPGVFRLRNLPPSEPALVDDDGVGGASHAAASPHEPALAMPHLWSSRVVDTEEEREE